MKLIQSKSARLDIRGAHAKVLRERRARLGDVVGVDLSLEERSVHLNLAVLRRDVALGLGETVRRKWIRSARGASRLV